MAQNPTKMDAKERRFSGVRKVFNQISSKVKRSQAPVKGQDSGYEELPTLRKASQDSTVNSDGFFAGDWEGGGTGRSSMLFQRFEARERKERAKSEGFVMGLDRLREEGSNSGRSGRGQKENRRSSIDNIIDEEVTKPRPKYLMGLDVDANGSTRKSILKSNGKKSSTQEPDTVDTEEQVSSDGKQVETLSDSSEGKKEGPTEGTPVNEGYGGYKRESKTVNVGGDIYTLPDKTINRTKNENRPKPVSANIDNIQTKDKDAQVARETDSVYSSKSGRHVTKSQQLYSHSATKNPGSKFTSLPNLESQQMNPLYRPDNDDNDDDDDNNSSIAPPIPHRQRNASQNSLRDRRSNNNDLDLRRRNPSSSTSYESATMKFDTAGDDEQEEEETVDEQAVELVEQVVRVVSEEREQLRVISDLDSVLEDEEDDVVEEPKPDPAQIHKNWSYVSKDPKRKRRDPDMVYQNWEVVKAEKLKKEPVYENVKIKMETEKSWPGADDRILEELEAMQIQKLCSEQKSSGSVVLTDEYSPKHFLSETPTHDASGMEIPAWKRHIMARQLAEKAMVEGEVRKKKEEEEARFKNMPPWKRALIEKKEAEFRSQQRVHTEKTDTPEKASSSSSSGPSWKQGLKSRKF